MGLESYSAVGFGEAHTLADFGSMAYVSGR